MRPDLPRAKAGPGSIVSNFGGDNPHEWEILSLPVGIGLEFAPHRERFVNSECVLIGEHAIGTADNVFVWLLAHDGPALAGSQVIAQAAHLAGRVDAHIQIIY